MDTNHAPGPWLSSEYNISNANGDLIASYCEGGWPNEADASLIAAAPELLAALEDALDGLDDVTAHTDADADRLGQVENSIRNAIAKAKGETK